MEWLNIHTSTIDSPEVGAAEPQDIGTWLKLLRYCAGQENGGRIRGAKEWPERLWLFGVKVTSADVQRQCGLWTWQGTDLLVEFYPKQKETEVRAKRKGGTKGAHSRWTDKKPASTLAPDSSPMPEAMPPAKPLANGSPIHMSHAEGEGKGKGKEYTHTPGARGLTPDWAEVEAFAQASGVDVPFARDWFERKVNSLTHGFATLVDWRADLLPYWRRNGAGQKNPAARGAGAVVNPRAKSLGAELMDLKRRHAALTAEVAEHPANENSAAYGTEPLTDAQLQDYRRVLGELRELAARLRSIPADAPEGWMRELRRQAFARAAEQHPGNPDSAAYDPQLVTENDRLEYLALRREGAGVAA
jgi:hypothetical protein